MQAVLRCVYRVYASFCRSLTTDYHRLAAKEALEMYRLNLDNRPVEKSAGLFLPIGGAAAVCSFRRLAAAQRLTPVSRLNLFYRNIRRKSASNAANSLHSCLF